MTPPPRCAPPPPPRAAWAPRVGAGADAAAADYDAPVLGGLRRFRDAATRALTEDAAARQRREALEDAARAQQLVAQGLPPDRAAQQVQVERQFRPDPARRAAEIVQDLRHQPLWGAAEAVLSPFEAAATASRYLGGVAITAPFQYGVEQYGFNPGARWAELGEEAAQQGLTQVPVLGGVANLAERAVRGTAEAGAALAGAVTGTPPRRFRSVAGLSLMGDVGTPPLRNPLDPAEALQRSRALLGPAELATSLLLPTPGAGALAGRLGAGAGALAGRLAPDVGRALPTVGGPVADALTSTAGRLALTAGPAALLGAIGAADPRLVTHQSNEAATPTERLEAAGSGVLLGLGLSGLLGLATRGLRATPRVTEPPPDWQAPPAVQRLAPALGAPTRFTRDPALERVVAAADAANQAAQGAAPARYPGGARQYALDRFKAAAIDDLAPATTFFDFADRVRVRQGLAALARGARGDLLLANSRGADAAADALTWGIRQARAAEHIVDHELPHFEQYRQAKMIAERWDAGVPTAQALVPDAAAAHRYLAYVRARIQATYPHDLTVLHRFDRFQDAITAAHNQSSLLLEEAGALPRGSTQRWTSKWQVYAVLDNVAQRHDALTAGRLADPYIVRSAERGVAHASDTLPGLSLANDLQRLRHSAATAFRNVGLRAFWDLAQQNDPAISQVLRVHQPPYAAVPRGWGRVPLLIDGEHKELLAPELLADALRGADRERLNSWARVLRGAAYVAKHGATTWNPAFLPVHAARAVQELAEKTRRGELGLSLQHLLGAFYQEVMAPLHETAALHPDDLAHLPARLASGVGAGLDRWLARNRDLALFRELGGGSSSATQLFARLDAAADALGVPTTGTRRLVRLPALVLRGAEDVLTTLVRIADETPRLAQFMTDTAKARQAGAPAAALLPRGGDLLQSFRAYAAPHSPLPAMLYDARTFTNDYSRSGTALRTLSQFIPLLNARKEGWLTSLGGLLEDPEKFVLRGMATFGYPTIAAYVAMRTAYGDAYDQLPVEEKDLYWHIPYGWWEDAQGRSHPYTLKLPKSPFVQLFTMPMEHILDTLYHTTAGKQALDPAHRTPRDAQHLLLAMLSHATLERGPEAFSDVPHLVASALALTPLGSVAADLLANEDHFTGRPILPPERRILPAQYQYTEGTSAGAKWLGQVTATPPVYWDLVATDLFGTLGREGLHSLDLAVEALQRAHLITGDPFAPTRAQDLPSLAGLPPEVLWRYVDALQREDDRPWLPTFFRRFLGTAYGGQTVRARAAQESPDTVRRWEAAQAFLQRRSEIYSEYGRAVAALEQRAPDLRASDYRRALSRLYSARDGAIREAAARAREQGAPVDPAERAAFVASLPGVGDATLQQFTATLPPGVDLAALLAQWQQPPGVDRARLNPLAQQQAREQWLDRTARQLGTAPGVLRDALGAYVLGQALPGLPVGALDVELLRAEYADPPDPADPSGQTRLDRLTTPPEQYRAAQRAVITRYAARWGVPEATLLERLNARFHLPGETLGPVQASEQRAAGVAARLADPAAFPRYADAHGRAYGTPAQWPTFDAALAAAAARYGPNRRHWPHGLRLLDDARRYGAAHRYLELVEHATQSADGLQDLVDYERWYGLGRDLTAREWDAFTRGALPKYRGVTDPAQAVLWDALYHVYTLLPEGPDKRRYARAARQIHRRALPRWQHQLDPTGAGGRALAPPAAPGFAGPSRLEADDDGD